LYNNYLDKYSNKEGLIANEEENRLKWKDGEYEITISFSSDHGRVYLMIRKPL